MKALFLALAVVSSAPGQAWDPSTVERTLEAELAETRTPGAALVVVRGDEILLSKGFGVASVETREPVTPDHLFRLGSTTKLFTAMALTTLAEQGKIDLKRPVGTIMPGLPGFVAQVSAHQLLSHTAGIKDQPADFGLHDESALAAFPRGWGDDYRPAAPGVAFSYSNPGLMGRFALAFLNGGRLEGTEVLSPAAIARVSTPQAEIPYDLPDMKRPRYGYGLFLHTGDGVALAEHVGTMPGFTSILKMATEERFAVILLANQEGVMFEKTLAAAFSSFGKVAASTTPEPKSVPMTESEMETVTGVYRNRWPVTIVHQEGALFLEQFGGRFPVTRLGGDLFSAEPPDGRRAIPFRLVAGADGKGELLQMFLWVFKKEEVAP